MSGINRQISRPGDAVAGPSACRAKRPADLFEGIPSWLEGILASHQTTRYVSPYLDDHRRPALVVWMSADTTFYRFHTPRFHQRRTARVSMREAMHARQ
jgi:hypothetical protein